MNSNFKALFGPWTLNFEVKSVYDTMYAKLISFIIISEVLDTESTVVLQYGAIEGD